MSGKITKLSQATINKIAAGEVITRPAAALKEMIENSLDASSTSISIVVRGGGLQLLQIQDSGHGILKEDLPLLCERFATSKLTSFEDLLSMQTYGFRGEALASISFVSKVHVTTMVEGSACAYKASFTDGKMIGEAKPTAGTRGTIISVEDMFYNVPARKSAFKSSGAEEYHRILAVVQAYAIRSAHTGVAFSCRKQGETTPDVNIPARTSTLDSICSVYGASMKRELLEVVLTVGTGAACAGSSSAGRSSPQQDTLSFIAKGYVSSASYSLKRGVFILFINGRLVDCAPLKRACESLYADLLPKGAHPFLYWDITLPAHHVDVNVHPTKREVGFLHQDELVESIVSSVRAQLGDTQSSRLFTTHAVLPLAPATSLPGPGRSAVQAVGLLPVDMQDVPMAHAGVAPSTAYKKVQTSLASFAAGAGSGGKDEDREEEDRRPAAKLRQGSMLPPPPAAPAPHKHVRVSAGAHGTMDQFLVSKAAAAGGVIAGAGDGEGRSGAGARVDAVEKGVIDVDEMEEAAPVLGSTVASKRMKRSRASAMPVLLTSVAQLRQEVCQEGHAGLAAALRRHVWVGVVDRHTSLIQYNTKLLLVNSTQLARELFYQRALFLFGNVASFVCDPRVPVHAMLSLALQAGGQGRGEAEAGATDMTLLLASKAAMLEEYFGVIFHSSPSPPHASALDTEGSQLSLTHLPRLVDGHTPVLHYLPDFLLQLACGVDWSEEKACFLTVCQSLALFYAHPPAMPHSVRQAVSGGAGQGAASEEEVEAYRVDPQGVYWRTQHILMPAVRHTGPLPSATSTSTGQEGQAEEAPLFYPPRKLAREHAVVQVACTEQLYRIFERC